MKQLKFASNFSLPVTQYASQANAILGIRDSGKTYTAMSGAEKLLDAGVPITVFDPVSVWKNLRNGINGNKGYPVIVAGAGPDADILLTVDNAVDIARAAMKAGISIIFDLFHKELANKSKWIRIVQEVVDMFVYENHEYGLRHLYFEEASEFIPQRIQPQQNKVYSSIERAARIGRNSSLGITIINQRAEEVNKAILELCALVFLHKQTGKNSLLSVKKWLDVMGWDEGATSKVKEIPALKQGECFILDSNNYKGELHVSKILAKKTFHPSPEKGVAPKMAKATVNISSFVKKLNAQLEKSTEKKTDDMRKALQKKGSGITREYMAAVSANNPSEKLKNVTTQLNESNAKYNALLIERKQERKQLENIIAALTKNNKDYAEELDKAMQEVLYWQLLGTEISTKSKLIIEEIAKLANFEKPKSKIKKITPLSFAMPPPPPIDHGPGMMILGKKGKGRSWTTADMHDEIVASNLELQTTMSGLQQQARGNTSPVAAPGIPAGYSEAAIYRMMKGVAMNPEGITKQKLAVLCCMTQSGTFQKYYGQLKQQEIIVDRDGLFWALGQCLSMTASVPDLAKSTDELLAVWYDYLGNGGTTRILQVIAGNRWSWCAKDWVAGQAEMAMSGTFQKYYGILKKYGLIEISKEGFKLSSNFLFEAQQ